MALSARAADYKSDAHTTTLQRADAGADEFLQALARAVQQFHTYPAVSNMCRNAIESCTAVLVSQQDREQVHFRVSPRDLIVDHRPTGRGTVVEQELARRLHLASIAEVTVERTVTPRELTRFCLDLIRCSGRNAERPGLIDLLTEHGVDRIIVVPAYRPEVLSVPPASDATAALVETERRRREELLATPGAVNDLYPPDKAWVRLDASSRAESVSLVELAVLAGEPAQLASMLMRLTDDSPEDGDSADALSRRFGDMTTLFAALEPRLARAMFAKLARAVLELEPDRRRALLRRTILPGLLDGRLDGSVLRDFPDLELADALCLLLDLETAAPEVVSTALARLELPAERQAALTPLLDERLRERAGTAGGDGLDAHARALMVPKETAARSFAEFAAFDVAMDRETIAALETIRDRFAAPDQNDVRLECLHRLMRLDPNPDAVGRLLDRAAPFLARMERDARWDALGRSLHRYRELATQLGEGRPDVAEVLDARLATMCTAERGAALADLAARDDAGAAVAEAIVRNLGSPMGPRLLAVATTRGKERAEACGRAAAKLLCRCADVLAPALVALAGREGDEAGDRIAARVFGLAGAGYEPTLGALLSSVDEQTVREAFRALAHIGTPQASALVCAAIQKQDRRAITAEESLWRFPASEALRQARALLGRREFVIRYPAVAARMLDRAAVAGNVGVKPVLAGLVPLRFRIWNPALARVGRRARALLAG